MLFRMHPFLFLQLDDHRRPHHIHVSVLDLRLEPIFLAAFAFETSPFEQPFINEKL